MEAAIDLAGFFAAHAVWCVSDGDVLVPFVAYETPEGNRQMNRLLTERLEDGVDVGKKWMTENPDSAARAVLIYDGFITLNGAKTDALLIIARDFTQDAAEVTIAVPYRPAGDKKGFAVHRPKFLGYKGPEPDWQNLGGVLWRGISKHEKGDAVWNAYLDQSK
jgi:hypothetical protein